MLRNAEIERKTESHEQVFKSQRTKDNCSRLAETVSSSSGVFDPLGVSRRSGNLVCYGSFSARAKVIEGRGLCGMPTGVGLVIRPEYSMPAAEALRAGADVLGGEHVGHSRWWCFCR